MEREKRGGKISYSSESLDEKFTKPLMRLVIACLDIMMPRKNGKSASAEVGAAKYDFDKAVAAIKSGQLYYKHEINIKALIESTSTSIASSSSSTTLLEHHHHPNPSISTTTATTNNISAKSMSPGPPLLSPKRRMTGGSPTRTINVKSNTAATSSSSHDDDVIHVHRVRWEALEQLMLAAVDCKHAEISNEIHAERGYFEADEAATVAKHKMRSFRAAISDLPCVAGKWNKTPSELRNYDSVEAYVATQEIPENERRDVLSMLGTSLRSGYLGQPYNFDDGALTEEWMCTYVDKRTSNTLPEGDIIKALTSTTLDMMCEQVRDRVCTVSGALGETPLNLRQGHLKEQPVFGIDCECRRLIEVVLVDRLGPHLCSPATLAVFIEKRLLPAINQLPGHQGHSMLKASEALANSLYATIAAREERGETSKPMTFGGVNGTLTDVNGDSEEDTEDRHFLVMAQTLLACVRELGIESFKIHPKGSGVVCVHPEGIPAHKVVCEYLGRLYPPYRWCERQKVVEQARAKFKLKPALPDFYNILLERPRQDPRGYGLLFVDASEQANIGSTLSHSCDNNCTSAVVSRNGKLTIVLTSSRYIAPGEELTHDYSAVTSSEDEWRAAVCLCGMSRCRGSFLHFATQSDLQQILAQHCSPLYRYSSLLKSSSVQPLSKDAREVLTRHGMHDLAMGRLGGSDGPPVPLWARKYAADILRFVEYERQALPCALMRQNSAATSTADSTENGASAAETAGAAVVKIEEGTEGSSNTDAAVTAAFAGDTATTVVASSAPAPAFESTFAMADMDACCVMEQRVQSLCCALSLAHRYISRQPAAAFISNSDISVEESNHHKPLELLSGADAAQFLLGEVEAVPALLRQYLLSKEATKSDAAAKKKGKGGKAAPAAVGASSDGGVENNGTNTAATAVAALEKEAAKQARDESKKSRALIESAIKTISEAVTAFSFAASASTASKETKSLAAAQRMVMRVRDAVMSIAEHGIRQARLQQLGDVLALLAHTQNFSRPSRLTAVQSDPISVPSRELGTGLKRSEIAEPSPESGNGSSSGSRKSATVSKAQQAISREIVPASELVYTGSMQYGPYFAFEQLMTWFTAGEDSEAGDNPVDPAAADDTSPVEGSTSTSSSSSSSSSSRKGKKDKDNNISKNNGVTASGNMAAGEYRAEADLFGSTLLPRPWQCFGASEGPYTSKQRALLLNILRSERLQSLPWPAPLRASFSFTYKDVVKEEDEEGDEEGGPSIAMDVVAGAGGGSGARVFGSPMLDVSLGNTQAVRQTLLAVSERDAVSNSKKSKGATKGEEEDLDQLDDRLPPEANSQWVQCDSCHRWRRLPWHVDADTLVDDWTCDKNTWEPEKATCDAAPDAWDPDSEDIADFSSGEKDGPVPPKVGEWRDVFCPRNLVYYEGQVLKTRTKEVGGITHNEFYVHFKGFKKNADEWVRDTSDRLRPHNMFTSVLAKTIYEQQAYQGMHVQTKATKKKAVKEIKERMKENESQKKRKRTEEEQAVLKAQRAAARSAAAAAKRQKKKEQDALAAEYDALMSTDDEEDDETKEVVISSAAGVTSAAAAGAPPSSVPMTVAKAPVLAPSAQKVVDLEAMYDAMDSDDD